VEKKCPCKTCVVYAICKLKEDIICDEAEDYCYNPDTDYPKYIKEKCEEVRDYLGKGVAIATGYRLSFSDVFSDDGEKLN
jgi:hypothetical protein